MASKTIPEAHHDAMVEAYLGGATFKEAAAVFGCCLGTCRRAVIKAGVERRSRSEANRLYAVDDAFFDLIDTEAAAYWLGFLTADGGITGSTVRLELHLQDIEHVRKFARDIKAEHPVVERERHRACGRVDHSAEFKPTSPRLVAALARLGVGERKTFLVKPCEQVPDHLLHHYWRGVFDGDGCISCRYRRGGSYLRWTINLYGNRAIVEGFRSFVSRFVKSRAAIRPDASIFRVGYGGTALPQEIAHVLYRDATIYLDRKYEKAQQLLATPTRRSSRR